MYEKNGIIWLFLVLGLLAGGSFQKNNEAPHLSYCPNVPESKQDYSANSVERECKKYFALGEQLVDSRKAADSDINTTLERMKCLTSTLTSSLASVESTCLKSGIKERIAYWRNKQLKSQRKTHSKNIH